MTLGFAYLPATLERREGIIIRNEYSCVVLSEDPCDFRFPFMLEPSHINQFPVKQWEVPKDITELAERLCRGYQNVCGGPYDPQWDSLHVAQMIHDFIESKYPRKEYKGK